MECTEIVSGLRFPEGPIAMPDGSIIVVEIERGTLSRVTAKGTIEVIADLGGGPNGAAMGPDGYHYFAADKFYEVQIDDTGGPPDVFEHFDYPFRNLGGPVGIVFPDGMKVGFGAGPDGQMLGTVSVEGIFTDGFESGDTSAWSNSVP